MRASPTSSAPYREPAEMPAASLVVPIAPPIGLVRANGSHCTCTPPGIIWCWWYGVATGDRWFCKHGGAWIRRFNHSALVVSGWWESKEECT